MTENNNPVSANDVPSDDNNDDLSDAKLLTVKLDPRLDRLMRKAIADVLGFDGPDKLEHGSIKWWLENAIVNYESGCRRMVPSAKAAMRQSYLLWRMAYWDPRKGGKRLSVAQAAAARKQIKKRTNKVTNTKETPARKGHQHKG